MIVLYLCRSSSPLFASLPTSFSYGAFIMHSLAFRLRRSLPCKYEEEEKKGKDLYTATAFPPLLLCVYMCTTFGFSITVSPLLTSPHGDEKEEKKKKGESAIINGWLRRGENGFKTLNGEVGSKEKKEG